MESKTQYILSLQTGTQGMSIWGDISMQHMISVISSRTTSRTTRTVCRALDKECNNHYDQIEHC